MSFLNRHWKVLILAALIASAAIGDHFEKHQHLKALPVTCAIDHEVTLPSGDVYTCDTYWRKK